MEATTKLNTMPLSERQKEKTRLRNIDLMKGFLILVVVVYHTFGIGNYTNTTYDFFGATLGCFFLLAGYCYSKTASYKEILIKRTKRFMIPTLIAMIIILLVTFCWQSASASAESFTETPNFVAYLKSFGLRIIDPYAFRDEVTFYPDPNLYLFVIYTPLWFVFRLYLVEIIFYAIRKVALKNIWSVLITVAICLSITQIYRSTFIFANDNSMKYFGSATYAVYPLFQADVAIAFVAVMVVGAYLRNINFAHWLLKGYKTWIYWIVTAIMGGLYALCVIKFSTEMGDLIFGGWFTISTNTHYMIYVWFLCQISFSYVLFFVASWLSKVKYVREVFIYFGKYTLFLLVFHTFVGCIVARFFGPTSNTFIIGSMLEGAYGLDTGSLTANNGVLTLTFFIVLILCIGFQHTDSRIKKCIGIAIKNRKAKKQTISTDAK